MLPVQINLKKTPITVQVKTGIKPSLTVAVKQKESIGVKVGSGGENLSLESYNNELLKYYELGKKDYQHGKTNTN
jgi:hypothetical protein|nr:MAG TPA: hypothetical protein [Caudoviricetes sp.]